MLEFTSLSLFGTNVVDAQQAKLITVKSVKNFNLTLQNGYIIFGTGLHSASFLACY